MQGCKGLSSLRRIRSSYSLESPLDSTAIYPINRSPNYTTRPVRKKPYQEQTLTLRVSLELDDNGLDRNKMEHLS